MSDVTTKDWESENLFRFARKHFELLKDEESVKWSQENDIQKKNRIYDEMESYEYLATMTRILQLAIESVLDTQNQVEKLANSLSKIEGSSNQIQKEIEEIKNQINEKRYSLLNKLKDMFSKYELKSFEVGAPGIGKAHFEKKDDA